MPPIDPRWLIVAAMAGACVVLYPAAWVIRRLRRRHAAELAAKDAAIRRQGVQILALHARPPALTVAVPFRRVVRYTTGDAGLTRRLGEYFGELNEG